MASTSGRSLRKSSESEEPTEDSGESDDDQHPADRDGDEESQSDNESKNYSDPLSNVWDSNDDDNGSNDGHKHASLNASQNRMQDSDDRNSKKEESDLARELSLSHQFVTIKTANGNRKIDLTPPDVLLKEAETLRKYYYRRRKADECIRENVRIIALTRIVYGDSQKWRHAQAHANLAQAYWELSEYALQTMEHAALAQELLGDDKALLTAKQSVTSLAKSPELAGEHADEIHHQDFQIMETSLLATYLHGKALLALKRFSEADGQFKQAMELLAKRKKPSVQEDRAHDSNFWKVEILSAMARTYIGQQKLDDAADKFEQLRSLMERRFGTESPNLITVYQEMAKLEQTRGSNANLDYAIELCLKAYRISKAGKEDISEAVGHAAQCLAAAYNCKASDETEAYTESYLNEAISCYQATLAHGDKRTLQAQEELAALMAKHGRPQEAAALLSSCLESIAEIYGEPSGRLALAHKQLATYCLQSGNSKEGAKHLKLCHDAEVQVFGAGSRRAKETEEALSVLLRNPSIDKIHGRRRLNRPRFQPIVKIPTLPNRIVVARHNL